MKLPRKILALSFCCGLLLIAQAGHTTPIGDPERPRIVVTVNGQNITENDLRRYARQRGVSPDALVGAQRLALIDELVNRELIYQHAVSLGMDKTPAMQNEIKDMTKNIVAGSLLNRSSDRFQVDEAAMRQEYEKRKAELGGTEYHARHILVESEHEAQAIIDQLNQGADFAKLAKEFSSDPSAAQGGDIGWFRAEEVMEPFGEAVAKLKPGEYTKKPVKTDFGWHVIMLEGKRAVEPPPFDSIKEQIRVGLQNRLMQNYIGDLRKKAKIEQP